MNNSSEILDSLDSYTMYCHGDLQAKLCMHKNQCFKRESNLIHEKLFSFVRNVSDLFTNLIN